MWPSAMRDVGRAVPNARVCGCADARRGDTATDRTSGQAALDDFTAFYQAGALTISCCSRLSGLRWGAPQRSHPRPPTLLACWPANRVSGITSFDMADHYGPAEQLVGQWIRQRSDAEGRDVRKDVQVST